MAIIFRIGRLFYILGIRQLKYRWPLCGAHYRGPTNGTSDPLERGLLLFNICSVNCVLAAKN